MIEYTDGVEHYCPCNGRCHTEKHPCSFSCVHHHGLIKSIHGVSFSQEQTKEVKPQ